MKQEEKELLGFIDFFRTLPDHRIERRKLHSVEEILLVTFCGVVACCDGWEDIELFGKTKIDFFKKHLPFVNGIPSDDTLRRFFRVLDPKIFEAYFIDWLKSFNIDLENKVVAIDGKTSRRSFDGDNKPLHLLSAFASEIGLTLGQQKVADKSNEITAIPKLLELLDIAGAIVTIDAMGCQHEIAKKILSKNADYLLALKGNQGQLHSDVNLFFEKRPIVSKFVSYKQVDGGHGRIETRVCTVTEDIGWLKINHPQWTDLRSIVEIESVRELKDKIATEKRYYISSLAADPKHTLEVIRQHWGIENSLHWVLDVCFGDDQSRIRKGNAPGNIAVIRKCALNLLQKIKQDRPRSSIKRLRKLAGWDAGFLDTVLSTKL
jgi:predicted transposase YbfD/YdcC